MTWAKTSLSQVKMKLGEAKEKDESLNQISSKSKKIERIMNNEQLTLRCCLGKKSRLNDSFSNRKTRTRINPRRTNCLWNELRRKIFLWNGRSGGSIDYSMEDIKNLRLSSELAYSLDWTETCLFENFRVGVRWGKVCFLMDSKFGFTSSCWRKKPCWFVLLKSANCYCSKAFVCRHREVLRKEVDLLTGGGWNRTRPKLLTTGLQWVLPILHYLRWIFPLDCPWGIGSNLPEISSLGGGAYPRKRHLADQRKLSRIGARTKTKLLRCWSEQTRVCW